VNRFGFEIGHVGQRIAFSLASFGGGAYSGSLRVKVNGQYTTLVPQFLKGTANSVAFDFGSIATRVITIETQLSTLINIDVDQYDALFVPPRESAPYVYIQADSFGDGSNGTDGGIYTGMAPQLGRALAGENYVIDSLGGTGLLKVNGASPNYLTRAQAYLPVLSAAGTLPDLAVILGSVNDTGYTTAQMQAQAAALYAAYAAYNIPVYHVVMTGSGGQSGMATVLAGYQAAAASAWNVLGVLDLTAVLSGTGYAQAAPPTVNDVTLATATGPAAGQYGYVWTGLVNSAETTASTEQIVTVGTGQAPTLSVRPGGGYTGYNVYRRPMDGSGNPTGAYVKAGSNVSAVWTDGGGATTAVTPPASNNTGSLALGTNTRLRSVDGTHPSQLGHDFYFHNILLALQKLIPGLR
jgi:lysophospholipase L1-like esterase